MAGKISQYPSAITTLASGDLFDVSEFLNPGYESKKLDWDDLLTNLNSQITFANIYTTDGTTTGERTISIGTNDLIFGSSGDVNLLRFDATADRIGIGTATPSVLFNVAGDAIVDDKFSINELILTDYQFSVGGVSRMRERLDFGSGTTPGDAEGKISFNPSTFIVASVGANNLNLETATGDIVFRLNAGDRGAWTTTGLGIGTTTPTEKLDVVGNGRFSGNLGVGVNPVAVGTILHVKSDDAVRFEGGGVGFGHQEFTQYQTGGGNNDYFRRASSGGASIDIYKFHSYIRMIRDGGDIRVGINTGTSTPSTSLHIKGTETNVDALRVDGNGTTNDLVVDFTGNVGIGTATPTAKLEVAGKTIINGGSDSLLVSTTGATNNLVVKDISGSSFVGVRTATRASIFTPEALGVNGEFYTSVRANILNTALVTTSGGVAVFASAQAGQDVRLATTSATDNIELKVGAVNVLFGQATTGNVGIGTTTPSEKLEVVGNIQTNGNVQLTTANSFVSVGTTPTTTLPTTRGVYINSGANVNGFANVIGVPDNGLGLVIAKNGTTPTGAAKIATIQRTGSVNELVIVDNASGATAIKLTDIGTENVINEQGNDVNFRVEGTTDASLFKVDAGLNNVGIGTATPSEKLEVAGNTYTTGQGSFGTGINPNSHLQVTASGKIVGIASNSNAITANNGSAIRGLATSTAAVEVYGVDGEASGTNATGDRTGVRGNAITTGSRNHYGGKFFSNNGSSQNIGVSGTTGNGTTGTIIRGVFGSSLYQGASNAYGGYFSAQGASTGENIGIFATAVNGASNYAIKSDGNVNMANLPTSSAGLSAGDLWNNAGVINIV